MSGKNGAKNGRKPGTFLPGNKVGRGAKGRSGRKPIVFKAECSRITDDLILPTCEAYVKAHKPDDAGYRWASDMLVAYGKGKPTQPIEMTTKTHEEALAELDGST